MGGRHSVLRKCALVDTTSADIPPNFSYRYLISWYSRTQFYHYPNEVRTKPVTGCVIIYIQVVREIGSCRDDFQAAYGQQLDTISRRQDLQNLMRFRPGNRAFFNLHRFVFLQDDGAHLL